MEYINTEEINVPSVGAVVIPGLLFAVVLRAAPLQAVNYEIRLTVSKNTIQWSVNILLRNTKQWILRKGGQEGGKDG